MAAVSGKVGVHMGMEAGRLRSTRDHGDKDQAVVKDVVRSPSTWSNHTDTLRVCLVSSLLFVLLGNATGLKEHRYEDSAHTHIRAHIQMHTHTHTQFSEEPL